MAPTPKKKKEANKVFFFPHVPRDRPDMPPLLD